MEIRPAATTLAEGAEYIVVMRWRKEQEKPYFERTFFNHWKLTLLKALSASRVIMAVTAPGLVPTYSKTVRTFMMLKVAGPLG